MAFMKQYNAKQVEEKIKKFWEKERIYKFNPKTRKKIYSIDTPPPYASSGHLHVGHALHYTQFEMMARVMRMLGKEVYFAPGFDDNGLPTEKYVEEKLKINKSKINRAEFRKLCLEESQKIEKEYAENVFKKLGHTYDWDLLYTTISPESQKVAQTVFLKLVKKKDCYRKEEPVIWCPYHETALAQAEVEDFDRTTNLNYIDFDVVDSKEGKEKITIATTRPEFLPACVAIFINPEDKKYKHLMGKEIIIPLFSHRVRIMKDERVDKDFGTGIEMVCTFGDTADIELWKKHNLDLKNLLNKDGSLKEIAGKYKGLYLRQAREQILEDLRKQGRLKKQEQLQQTVGTCWRCSTPVEYIVTKQWFIKTLDYKKELVKRGRQIKWIPAFMRTRFENWTENLAWDWVISRQRYYGIPIPVWYCENCDEIIFPEEKELPLDPMETEKRCKKCRKKAVPDTDVFDTWMTSSNSPEIACKWLEKPGLYKKITPMSLRPQSHDIIRTWAFYTILKSHLLFHRIPWEKIMIGTYVLDPKGKGMHKSRGNAVWADELIEKYSVDSFRYWVGSAGLGADLPFKEKELVSGKRFINKLWNASRFVFINLKDYNGKDKPSDLKTIDKWVLQKTREMVEKAKEQYMSYNISGARRTIEDFFWKVFTDNYLELVKKRIYNSEGSEKKSAQYTLYNILFSILKMITPITPFITEELYQEFFKSREGKKKSIHLFEFPKIKRISGKNDFDLLVEFLSKVRQEKTKAKKSMNSEIVLTLEQNIREKLKYVLPDLKAVTNAKKIKKGKFNVEFI